MKQCALAFVLLRELLFCTVFDNNHCLVVEITS